MTAKNIEELLYIWNTIANVRSLNEPRRYNDGSAQEEEIQFILNTDMMSLEDTLDANQRRDAVHAALQTLSPNDYLLVSTYLDNDLDTKDTAKAFHERHEKTKMRLARALRKLRSALRVRLPEYT